MKDNQMEKKTKMSNVVTMHNITNYSPQYGISHTSGELADLCAHVL